MVDHVAELPRETEEIEVASAGGHSSVLGRDCSRSEVPRAAFGRHLSGCFGCGMMVHGALVDFYELDISLEMSRRALGSSISTYQ